MYQPLRSHERKKIRGGGHIVITESQKWTNTSQLATIRCIPFVVEYTDGNMVLPIINMYTTIGNETIILEVVKIGDGLITNYKETYRAFFDEMLSMSFEKFDELPSIHNTKINIIKPHIKDQEYFILHLMRYGYRLSSNHSVPKSIIAVKSFM